MDLYDVLNRTDRVSVRVTPPAREAVKAAARIAGLPEADYVRGVLIDASMRRIARARAG